MTTATAVKSRPIIFSAPMIGAILEGRKTQTRLVMQLQPTAADAPHIDLSGPRHNGCVVARWPGESEFDGYECHCKSGAPGDQLWMCEKFAGPILTATKSGQMYEKIVYAADGKGAGLDHRGEKIPWRSPIHMPKWASRITLEITKVRVQRLQEISHPDALAEGTWAAVEADNNIITLACARAIGERDARGQERSVDLRDYFAVAWDSINGKKHPWASNPYVWALTFRVVGAGGAA